jgi:hypothetical protein
VTNRWGRDPVHPSVDTHQPMAEELTLEIWTETGNTYTNSSTKHEDVKEIKI